MNLLLTLTLASPEISCPPRASDPPSREYLCYILERYAEYDALYRHFEQIKEQLRQRNAK